jgi:transposase
MEQQSVRKVISDKVWEQLEPTVMAAKHSQAGKPAEQNERLFLEALLWLARTGSPWRDLPAELGGWHNVYMRFRRWERSGVWRRLWVALQTEAMTEAREVFIDSTTVRAHQHAAGAPKKTVAMRLWAAREGG